MQTFPCGKDKTPACVLTANGRQHERRSSRNKLVSDFAYPPISPLKTGVRGRCPRCGEGPVFKGYLQLRESCPECGLDYSFADPADGPAFFVMCAVGVVGMVAFMIFEFTVHPPIWVHFVVTFPILAAMCLSVLRPFKGWMVSEQYFHKAEEATFVSVGKHGDGYGWRGQAERAAKAAARDKG